MATAPEAALYIPRLRSLPAVQASLGEAFHEHCRTPASGPRMPDDEPHRGLARECAKRWARAADRAPREPRKAGRAKTASRSTASTSGAPATSTSTRTATSPFGRRAPEGPGVSLPELVRDLEQRGLRSPLLIRFSDVLASTGPRPRRRLRVPPSASTATRVAYRAVYPIKVNQQRHVVEEIVDHGSPFGVGLEAGSKPELLVALAVLDQPRGA